MFKKLPRYSSTIVRYPMGSTRQVRAIAQYLCAAVALSAALYYLPNYFIFERFTADSSAALLNWIGIAASSWVRDGSAFVNEFEIERMCTGVQVIAVFVGILVPLPRVDWKRKVTAILSVAMLVYVANIARIALEVLLLYRGILPWSLAHYPTGLILGVFSVGLLVILLDRFIPEIGEFVLGAAESLTARKADPATPR
jgi:exosortase/archaeosortase family protein